MPSRPPVIVRTYSGPTQALAAEWFAADAAKAADDGYLPSSQAWDGVTLTVTYQRQPLEQTPPEPESAPRRSAEASATSSVGTWMFRLIVYILPIVIVITVALSQLSDVETTNLGRMTCWHGELGSLCWTPAQ